MGTFRVEAVIVEGHGGARSNDHISRYARWFVGRVLIFRLIVVEINVLLLMLLFGPCKKR